jgi:hypothetical protein
MLKSYGSTMLHVLVSRPINSLAFVAIKMGRRRKPSFLWDRTLDFYESRLRRSPFIFGYLLGLRPKAFNSRLPGFCAQESVTIQQDLVTDRPSLAA